MYHWGEVSSTIPRSLNFLRSSAKREEEEEEVEMGVMDRNECGE